MKLSVLVATAALTVAGCGGTVASAIPTGSAPASSTVRTERAESGRGQPARGPRKLNGVPPGHFPKAGQCRLWHSGRPPGQQPKPTSCSSLHGKVPAGAFILYGDRAYDAEYDWAAQARRERGSVPEAIVEIIRSIR